MEYEISRRNDDFAKKLILLAIKWVRRSVFSVHPTLVGSHCSWVGNDSHPRKV